MSTEHVATTAPERPVEVLLAAPARNRPQTRTRPQPRAAAFALPTRPTMQHATEVQP